MKVLNFEWIADLGAMTCRNTRTRITVQFEKKGKLVTGKISDMPESLLRNWILYGEYSELAKKTVMEAEDIFLKAYFEKELEKRRLRRRKVRFA